ncbi:hypothetical protein Patl1_02339 [Pistacia atlantica]|uniref:Uncharacterized protein n=1 Tax=Pistacia atlantica TaxID=434234 RepID=A0ACC1C7D6_9ROSI|nr:hypothetical protein Patl1_02339 [Pistacia atlantica]
MDRSKNQGYLWILRSIFVLAAVVFVVGIVWFYVKYRNFRKTKRRIALTKWKSFHKIGFSEFEIIGCLKEENLIGSGASGRVYKVVLNSGEAVAVKKLFGRPKRENASNGSQRDEFEVEVETLGKIRHKNIVRLWCCCNSGDSKLLRDFDSVIDPKLDSSHKEETCRVLEVSLLCTNALPINRPSMRKVVKLLQEASTEKKLQTNKKDGKLSPYYHEDASDQFGRGNEAVVRQIFNSALLTGASTVMLTCKHEICQQ